MRHHNYSVIVTSTPDTWQLQLSMPGEVKDPTQVNVLPVVDSLILEKHNSEN